MDELLPVVQKAVKRVLAMQGMSLFYKVHKSVSVPIVVPPHA